MSFVTFHNGLANACLIFSLVIGGYGLWRFIRNRGVDGNFWGVLVIGEVLYLAQALVGVWLAVQGGVPARGWIHYLYGVVQIISIPGLYAYTRGRDTRREALLYALIGLFLAGVSIRAMTTALETLPF
jgi:hypothetical protein